VEALAANKGPVHQASSKDSRGDVAPVESSAAAAPAPTISAQKILPLRDFAFLIEAIISGTGFRRKSHYEQNGPDHRTTPHSLPAAN
jgi:hypothetical protein